MVASLYMIRLIDRGVWEVARVFLSDWYIVWECWWLPGSCYVLARVSVQYVVWGGCQGVYMWLLVCCVWFLWVFFYLIDILYGSVGGYQGVARVSLWLLWSCVWGLRLPGCLYLIGIWECGWMQGVAMRLPGCLYLIGIWQWCSVHISCECSTYPGHLRE